MNREYPFFQGCYGVSKLCDSEDLAFDLIVGSLFREVFDSMAAAFDSVAVTSDSKDIQFHGRSFPLNGGVADGAAGGSEDGHGPPPV